MIPWIAYNMPKKNKARQTMAGFRVWRSRVLA